MVEQAGTSAQRIRIGLTGLAFAFVLVLLGSAISGSGEDAPITPNTTVEAEPKEPLAELGVAPGAGEDTAKGEANASGAAAANGANLDAQ
jgi:hypothetical protein